MKRMILPQSVSYPHIRVLQQSSQRFHSLISLFVLTGALSAGSGFTGGSSAIAAPIHSILFSTNPTVAQTRSTDDQGNRQVAQMDAPLPSTLADTLRQDLSQQIQIPISQLQVVEARQQTWSDGCLGLGKLDESCLQALVEGWRVVLSDGQQRWVYHTDATGSVYRLAPPTNGQGVSLPPADSIVPVSQKISQANPSNHSLGARMSASELPPALRSGSVFRVISTGGFMGKTYQTTLLNDGRLIRTQINLDGTLSEPQVRRVSWWQVREFQRLLQQEKLERFDRLNYPARSGSADFLTITMSSRSGTVRYADSVVDQLPDSLQTIIEAWNKMTTAE